MPNVEIYTKSHCPFCKRAKALLDRLSIPFTEYEISSDVEKTAEMIKRAGGRRTVPQVFIGDRHIGGSDDLAALKASGDLQALIDRNVAA